MPRYFFNTKNGECLRDDQGVELSNLEAAKAEAAQILVESLNRSPQTLWETGHFSVIVTDEAGLTLVVVDADGAVSPAAAGLG